MLPILSYGATALAFSRSSPGCGQPPLAEPGGWPLEGHIYIKDSAGAFSFVKRHYELNIPAVYDPFTPASLVIVFHGFYDNDQGELS
jgi:hypothetical protein